MSSMKEDLFEYTGGRFLFNEELRRAERRLNFDIGALAITICRSVNRTFTDLASITKLAEEGFNRVLQATFKDGYAVLARIPFRITVPAHYAVASEAATLGLLRNNDIPVPKVFAYSSVDTNTVGTEYLVLEKVEGTPLIEIESRYLNIQFPASGSLYYRKGLINSEHSIPVPGVSQEGNQIVVGPTAQYEWWYQERSALHVDRGPWSDFLACYEAPAKHEIEFCRLYGKSCLHVERYLREIHGFRQMLPTVHIQLLYDFLKLAPHLNISSRHPFSRPVLRHPDFSPSNILVNSLNEIVAIIDWQHAAILPLCLCAGIPKHFQNWGDLVSEQLTKPDMTLLDDFQSLDSNEQHTIRELMRKRIVHFYYAALTMGRVPDHFDTLRNENAMLRAKLFDRVTAPWEGDSISLKYTIIQAQNNWPMELEEQVSRPGGDGSRREAAKCPVRYSDDAISYCLDKHSQEDEKMEELQEMRELIGTDALGWVPDDQHLENSRPLIPNDQVRHATTLEH